MVFVYTYFWKMYVYTTLDTFLEKVKKSVDKIKKKVYNVDNEK